MGKKQPSPASTEEYEPSSSEESSDSNEASSSIGEEEGECPDKTELEDIEDDDEEEHDNIDISNIPKALQKLIPKKGKKASKGQEYATILRIPLEELLQPTGLEHILTEKRQKTVFKQPKASQSSSVTATKKRTRSLEVKNPEAKYYDDEEKSYHNKLTEEEKRYVAILEHTIKDMNKDDVPIRFKILLSKIDDKIKAIAIKKLSYLYGMDSSSSEYYKTINWIESLCKLPIGKYKPLPFTKISPKVEIRTFIQTVQNVLDETVYGHKEAKDQIVRLLAQRISNPSSCGNVIGICSPPGCGKTLLAKHGISKALDLPFSFISLGGLEDSSHFVGHSFTYEGSSHGKVADLLMKAGYMNPVIFFDELDKVSQTYKGEEIINLLIHMTDATQNDRFEDKYFTDVGIDLSQCILIFSYNNESMINPILKDRMIRINIDGYKVDDKVKIAQKYLLRDLCKQFGFKREDIHIEDDIVKYIIANKVEEEQGVRNLRRALEHIMSNINLKMIMEEEQIEFPFVVSEKIVNKYVMTPRNKDQDKLNSIYT